MSLVDAEVDSRIIEHDERWFREMAASGRLTERHVWKVLRSGSVALFYATIPAPNGRWDLEPSDLVQLDDALMITTVAQTNMELDVDNNDGFVDTYWFAKLLRAAIVANHPHVVNWVLNEIGDVTVSVPCYNDADDPVQGREVIAAGVGMITIVNEHVSIADLLTVDDMRHAALHATYRAFDLAVRLAPDSVDESVHRNLVDEFTRSRDSSVVTVCSLLAKLESLRRHTGIGSTDSLYINLDSWGRNNQLRAPEEVDGVNCWRELARRYIEHASNPCIEMLYLAFDAAVPLTNGLRAYAIEQGEDLELARLISKQATAEELARLNLRYLYMVVRYHLSTERKQELFDYIIANKSARNQASSVASAYNIIAATAANHEVTLNVEPPADAAYIDAALNMY